MANLELKNVHLMFERFSADLNWRESGQFHKIPLTKPMWSPVLALHDNARYSVPDEIKRRINQWLAADNVLNEFFSNWNIYLDKFHKQNPASKINTVYLWRTKTRSIGWYAQVEAEASLSSTAREPRVLTLSSLELNGNFRAAYLKDSASGRFATGTSRMISDPKELMKNRTLDSIAQFPYWTDSKLDPSYALDQLRRTLKQIALFEQATQKLAGQVKAVKL